MYINIAMKRRFEVASKYKPAGDWPEASKKLVEGVNISEDTQSFGSKKQDKENGVLSYDKIRYSLIAMAVMATTGIIYKKLKPKVIEPIKTSILHDFCSSLSQKEIQ